MNITEAYEKYNPIIDDLIEYHGADEHDPTARGESPAPILRDLWSAIKDAATTPDHPAASETKPSEPTAPAGACECLTWCELDHRVAFLTGHHSRCPKGGSPLDATYALLKELTRGIECWAVEEDGEVYMDCWKAYRKAKALEGIFLPDDEQAHKPSSLTGHIVEIGDLQRPEGEPPVTGLVVRVPYEQLAAHKSRIIFADVTITPNEASPANG